MVMNKAYSFQFFWGVIEKKIGALTILKCPATASRAKGSGEQAATVQRRSVLFHGHWLLL